MIKIDFEFETPYGVFRDALHLPVNHGMPEHEVKAMMEQRRDNWIAIITAPPPENPPESAVTADVIEVAGETYNKLEGTPQSGAKLIEVNGVWYYRM